MKIPYDVVWYGMIVKPKFSTQSEAAGPLNSDIQRVQINVYGEGKNTCKTVTEFEENVGNTS